MFCETPSVGLTELALCIVKQARQILPQRGVAHLENQGVLGSHLHGKDTRGGGGKADQTYIEGCG